MRRGVALRSNHRKSGRSPHVNDLLPKLNNELLAALGDLPEDVNNNSGGGGGKFGFMSG